MPIRAGHRDADTVGKLCRGCLIGSVPRREVVPFQTKSIAHDGYSRGIPGFEKARNLEHPAHDSICAMEYCIAMTICGDPCPYPATIGDYCVLHARGWDEAKADVAMLWAVYGGVTTILGVISTLQVVFGASAVFRLERDGEVRIINLGQLKDSAERLIGVVDLLVAEGSRQDIENIGKTVAQLHKDVNCFVEHMGAQSAKIQISQREAETT